MKYIIVTVFFLSIVFCGNTTYIDSAKVRNPKLAWKLSMVPGLGQLYNGKIIKSTFFIFFEFAAINQFMNYKHNNKIELRNTYAWWIFGLHVWNMLDAYVDAQLSTFPINSLEPINSIDSLKINLQ